MKRYIFKNLIVFTLALLGGNAHADLDDAYTISAYPTLNFFYPADGPILTCNDEEKPNKIPTACTFVDKGGQGQLDLTLTTWDGQHALLTSKDGVISGQSHEAIPAYRLTGQEFF